MRRSRKPLSVCADPGFESLSLRQLAFIISLKNNALIEANNSLYTDAYTYLVNASIFSKLAMAKGFVTRHFGDFPDQSKVLVGLY